MRTSRLIAASVAAGCVAAALSPWSLAADAAVNPSLVVFYRFNAHSGTSVIDTSNSHLNGTLVNVSNPDAAYVTSVSGYGKALSLTAAAHQYVDVPQGPTLDVNRFTLAALVRYTGSQTPETLDRWEVLEKAGAYWLNIRTDGHVRAGGFFGGCANSQFWKYLDSAAAVPVNTWTHVAATYNGSRLTIYIDGVASGSRAITGTTCANDEPLAVGAKNAPTKGILEAFWDGQLDDVRVYNKALTATAIANLAP